MRILFITVILIICASCSIKPVFRSSNDRPLKRSERFYNCLTGLNKEGFKQSFIEPMCKRMINVD